MLNVSLGGITSVKSHHRKMGLGNEPVASKVQSEMDDEPLDPSFDEEDEETNNYAILDL